MTSAGEAGGAPEIWGIIMNIISPKAHTTIQPTSPPTKASTQARRPQCGRRSPLHSMGRPPLAPDRRVSGGPSLSLSGRVPGRNYLPSPIAPAEDTGPARLGAFSLEGTARG